MAGHLMSACSGSLMYCTAYPAVTSASNCPTEVLFMGFIALGRDLLYNLVVGDADVPCDIGS